MIHRPEDILREVMLASPTASQKDHRDTMWDQIKDNPQMQEAIFDQWFSGRYPFRAVKPVDTGGVQFVEGQDAKVTFSNGQPVKAPAKSGWPNTQASRASARRRQMETARRRKKRAEAQANEFRQRCLLDLPLPDGTLLRDATGSQCIQAGGWFALVGKRAGKGSIIGKKLTNDQLHNLWVQAS